MAVGSSPSDGDVDAVRRARLGGSRSTAARRRHSRWSVGLRKRTRSDVPIIVAKRASCVAIVDEVERRAVHGGRSPSARVAAPVESGRAAPDGSIGAPLGDEREQPAVVGRRCPRRSGRRSPSRQGRDRRGPGTRRTAPAVRGGRRRWRCSRTPPRRRSSRPRTRGSIADLGAPTVEPDGQPMSVPGEPPGLGVSGRRCPRRRRDDLVDERLRLRSGDRRRAASRRTRRHAAAPPNGHRRRLAPYRAPGRCRRDSGRRGTAGPAGCDARRPRRGRPPDTTSPASWGQVDTVRSISIIEAADRSETWSTPTIWSARRTRSSPTTADRSADSISGAKPWKSGRAGSRSKRSTSSIPPSAVAITTGSRRRRASLRRSTFIAKESHSSTTTSAPSRNRATLAGLTPSGIGSTRRNGSISHTMRAASTALG